MAATFEPTLTDSPRGAQSNKKDIFVSAEQITSPDEDHEMWHESPRTVRET